MFTVEVYAKIRHAVMVDGLSRREAAKRFGVDGGGAIEVSGQLTSARASSA